MTREPDTSRHHSLSFGLLVFCFLIGGLALFEVVFGVAMDYVYANSSRNPVAAVKRANADAVILGSSTGTYAFQPSQFRGSIYNAAENGQGAYYVAATLRQIRPGSQLRRVIFSIDPADIASGLADSKVGNLSRFAPWAGENDRLRAWLARNDSEKAFLLHFALYRYRAVAPGILRGWMFPEWSADGYSPLSGEREAAAIVNTIPATTTEVEIDPNDVLHPSPSGVELLSVIAAEVRRLDIQLIMVSPPLMFDQRGINPKYEPVFTAAREAFSDVVFCDLTGTEIDGVDDLTQRPELFFDGTHMTREGARLYSAEMDKVIHERCGDV